MLQVTRNGNDLWLSYWVAKLDPHEHHHRPSHTPPTTPSLSPPPDNTLHQHSSASFKPSWLHYDSLSMPRATAASYASLTSFGPIPWHPEMMPHPRPSPQATNATSSFRQAASTAVAGDASPVPWEAAASLAKSHAAFNTARRAAPQAAQAAAHYSLAASRKLFEDLVKRQLVLDPDTKFYLTVLLCIAAANSVFTFVRAFSFAYGGLVAAWKLHEQLLTAVINAPARFFHTTVPGKAAAGSADVLLGWRRLSKPLQEVMSRSSSNKTIRTLGGQVEQTFKVCLHGEFPCEPLCLMAFLLSVCYSQSGVLVLTTSLVPSSVVVYMLTSAN